MTYVECNVGDRASVDAAIRYLSSPEARYVTGAVLPDDGGMG